MLQPWIVQVLLPHACAVFPAPNSLASGDTHVTADSPKSQTRALEHGSSHPKRKHVEAELAQSKVLALGKGPFVIQGPRLSGPNTGLLENIGKLLILGGVYVR